MGRGPPLAGLSGAVRMMNGRPARAVRAVMGAGELYITLLSVCERLLKALKSPGSDTGHATSHQTSPNCCQWQRLSSHDKIKVDTQVRPRSERGEQVMTCRWFVLFTEIMCGKWAQQQSSITGASSQLGNKVIVKMKMKLSQFTNRNDGSLCLCGWITANAFKLQIKSDLNFMLYVNDLQT